MKNGVPVDNSQRKTPARGGYRFSGNTHDIFEKFFGTSNPFTITLNGKGEQITALEQLQTEVAGEWSIEGLKLSSIGTFIKKDLIVTVDCTLEEFFHGCRKEIIYTKTVMCDDMKHER